jgi:hypothetical protein
VKGVQIRSMLNQAKNFVPPPEIVTSSTVKVEVWETAPTSVDTLNALRGDPVAAELAGKVAGIIFESATLRLRFRPGTPRG